MQTKKDVRQVVRDFYRDQQEEEARDKALELGVPFFDLRFLEPEKDAMSYITKEESEKAGAIPIKIKNRALTIGFIDPQTKEAEKLAESLTKNYPIKGVVSAIISRPSFSEQTELFAGITKKKTIHEQDDTISIEDHGEITLQNLESEIQNAPLQEMLTKLIFVAVRAEASDIHIEPEETRARIRLRLDGVLFPIGYIDKERYKYLLSQLQLTSKLKLNSKNPQNGRFEIAIDKKDLNIRIETMPTLYGEDVVMRIFNKQATALDISELGIMKYHKSILDKTIARPHGMILVVGPTGAGKTSTSYAILNKINSSKVKVITIEDPIEYTLKGATQTQINEGDTFADRLKAVLREDPDIVMVGEIRDIATAETALHGALTGHMVISSLHANDAVTALTRLFDMTADPTVINTSISIIIAQRLVRKICPYCKIKTELTEVEKNEIKEIISTFDAKLPNNLTFFTGKGCDRCNGVGLKGRTGIFEILELKPEIQDMLLNKPSFYDIKKKAKSLGMITMEQDGLIKALSGITTVSEILKAIKE